MENLGAGHICNLGHIHRLCRRGDCGLGMDTGGERKGILVQGKKRMHMGRGEGNGKMFCIQRYKCGLRSTARKGWKVCCPVYKAGKWERVV